MASTNQINRVVELIAVLGDLIILNFCLFQLTFLLGKCSYAFSFFLYCFFDDDFA